MTVKDRTLVVARPWAWLRWPADMPLVGEDPDVTDRREPRIISTVDADWEQILDAVQFATWNCAAGEFDPAVESIEADVPYPMDDLEYELAQAWVGEASPVTVDYVDGLGVTDGRHRVWLTREFHAQRGWVPVADESLLSAAEIASGQVEDALNELFVDSLDRARQWWESPLTDTRLRDVNRRHMQMLGSMWLTLTHVPVSEGWYRWLADGRELTVLADLYQQGRVDHDLLARWLPRAWRLKPDVVRIDHELTLRMFRELGFRIDGEPFRSLSQQWGSVRLFRGSNQTGRRGVSWTSNREVAAEFARNRQRTNEPGQVWEVSVPVPYLLAYFRDPFARETEFIVDLDSACIEPHPESQGREQTFRSRILLRWLELVGWYLDSRN